MSVMETLLSQNAWGAYASVISELEKWRHWPLFRSALSNLKRESLYQSPIHGEGHIERTMLFGALAGRDENLDESDVILLMDACAYHDVGRVDDSLDDDHGRRSTLRLAELTGRSGEELLMLMAAVEAHSRDDREMDSILESYNLSDYLRTHRLAEMLKDSDGLDRVRICGALDPAYLRRPGSRSYVLFSEYLFSLYGGKKAKF